MCIVRREWIQDAYAEYSKQQQQQHNRSPAFNALDILHKYQIQPFHALNICVTGLSIERRDQIQQLVTAHGGTYCRDLTRKCTHLICAPTQAAMQSSKCGFARNWGMYTVTEKWLVDCMNVGGNNSIKFNNFNLQ